MSDVVPIFYDHSSRKSLLTYWNAKDTVPGAPQSIVGLCKSAGLKECFGVSTNFHTFLEAWKNLKEEKISFRFGLQLTLCDDAKVHTDDSLKNEHKVIVFMKNSNAYVDLIRLYTACASDPTNRYYLQRFDCKQLKQHWTDNLLLAIPFFDSCIHANMLRYGASIVPDFPVKPMIFREVDSGVPFASLIDKALDLYNADGSHEEVKTKTIYYEKKDDLEAYITERARKARGSFSKPNLNYMCSPRFCFEEWKELTT
jgi:hypothetical protein